MEMDTAITLCRETFYLTLLICAPILVTGIVIGFAVGLFQALTQIQEQTLAIIVKMVAMMIVATWSFAWMMTKLVEFATILFENIPDTISFIP